MKNTIKEYLRSTFISEVQTPGISITKKSQNDSNKINKAANAETIANMTDYAKPLTVKQKGAIKLVKRELSASEEELRNHYEKIGGMANLVYDSEVSEAFKERQEMAIKGDPRMGNETKTGKWNPETGEGNGNTEPTWGGSSVDFGEKLIQQTKKIKQLKDDATDTIVQFGDDIELSPEKSKLSKKKVAVEGVNTMKRLKFKKPFNGLEHAVSLIPESHKVDNKEFEITDGNETHRVRFVGSLKESFVPWFALNGTLIGDIEVISSVNRKTVDESYNKIKHLFDYKSSDTLGITRGKSKINENDILKNMFTKTRSIALMEELNYSLKEYGLKESDLKLGIDKFSEKLMDTGQFETKLDALTEAKIMINKKVN